MAGPRLARHLIDRPRLLARLDARAPLTVLRAPVGYGKTTLVAQWLRRQPAGDETVVWIRPRREDGDFWVGLLDALAHAGLPVPASDRPHRTQVERAVVRADRPLLLVVDGFENVAADGIDAALLDLVWYTPQLRLTVCQRSHRHFATEGLLDLEPTLIGAHELLFTADELAELFALVGLDVTPEQVRAIHAESAGWPEPTKTFALTMRDARGQSDPHLAAAAIASDYRRRRLVPETNRPDRVEFALATSLPDEFCVELAELLSDDRSAKAHLEWLEGEGVLLADRRGGELVYHWPGAAKQALVSELQQRHPERIPELHSRLARWYLRGERPGLAVHHAVQARNWPLVVNVIDTHWRQLILRHRGRLYEALVAAPLEAIATSPRAVAVRDMWLRGPDDRVLGLNPLPPSTPELAELGNGAQAREVLDVGLAVLLALRRRGRFDRARSHGDRLLQVARSARTARTADVVGLLPGVHLHTGLARLLGDDVPGALGPLEQAYDWAPDSSLDYVASAAAGALALVHGVTGQARTAAAWLHRADAAPRPSTWLAPQIRTTAVAARLLVAVDHLDSDAADRAAADFPELSGPTEFWAYVAYSRLLHALAAGTALDGLDLLDRTRGKHSDWLDHGAAAGPLLAAVEADLLLALGQGNHAHAVLHGAHSRHPLLRLGQARLALLAGRPLEALRLTADPAWAAVATTRHRLGMLLVQAVAAQRLDDLRTAKAALRRAVDSARAASTLRPFTTVPRAELITLAAHVPTAAELLADPVLADRPDLFPARITLIRLTDREHQVLSRLADGLTVQQVAESLVVSYNTVKTQQRSLYHKLGADSRPDALARARQWGLLAS